MLITSWIILIASLTGFLFGSIRGYMFANRNNEEKSDEFVVLYTFVGMLFGVILSFLLSVLAVFLPIVFVSVITSAIIVRKLDTVRRAGNQPLTET